MKTIGVSLAMLLSLTGCQERAASTAPRLAHPNGLELSPPAGFDATRTADGFVLEESGQLRSPRRFEIRLVKTMPEMPEMPGMPKLLATGAIARFAIHEMEGGSGGAEYELRALAAIGDRWIVLVAMEQSELGQPDFAEAWRLLESARRRAD